MLVHNVNIIMLNKVHNPSAIESLWRKTIRSAHRIKIFWSTNKPRKLQSEVVQSPRAHVSIGVLRNNDELSRLASR